MSKIDYGLGALATTIYTIASGGFEKISESDGIDEVINSDPIPLLKALGVFFGTVGLSKLVRYFYTESKNSKKNPRDSNTPWLFERLK